MLDVEAVVDLFRPDGPLARALPRFESRPQQIAMATDVATAFAEGKIALIEAGTGTGKSIAYLLPTLVAAARLGKRTVISTHTISLQEQLLHKDIPLLTRALGLDERAVVMKGMANYLCRRRLDDAMQDRRGFAAEDREEIEQIAHWSAGREEGSLTELEFQPSRSTWDKVRMEGDACSHAECPHFRRCLFFRARREAGEARVLIVNHHLLLADLAMRTESGGKGGILPEYDHLIIDEAHNLEEIATEACAVKISRNELNRILSRLLAEQRNHRGKLLALADKIAKFEGESRLLHRIEVELPAEKRDLSQIVGELFQVYFRYFERLGAKERLRLQPSHLASEGWIEEVHPMTEHAVEAMRAFVQSIRAIDEQVGRVVGESCDDRIRSLRFDISVLADRLERMAGRLAEFAFEESDPSTVRWIEALHPEIRLVRARLDVAPLLADGLFARPSSVVLSSATLATNQSFDFIRRELGIGEEFSVIERIYDSPFEYEKQALLAVPIDLPSPDDHRFTAIASEVIVDAVRASQGSAFLLFTSFRMLGDCYDRMGEILKAEGFSLFRQGEMERHQLLEAFKATPRSVLFGTDSFWEGVDVVGEALRLVIIPKLPFKVPTDPLVEARSERVKEEGRDPFMHVSVPQAIVKFKQGYGRLIRNESDQGCILCLDSRLVKRGYGRLFVRSLPTSSYAFGPCNEVLEKIRTFYTATLNCRSERSERVL